MTRPTDPRLHRLAHLAEMVRSARLSRLAAARAARDGSMSLLAGLDCGTTADPDPAVAIAALRHQRWAELRRARLDAEIRRQDAIIEAERDAAARAVARCLAVGRLLGGKR